MDKEVDLSFEGILDWVSGTIASGIAAFVEEVVLGWAQTIIDAFLGTNSDLG